MQEAIRENIDNIYHSSDSHKIKMIGIWKTIIPVISNYCIMENNGSTIAKDLIFYFTEVHDISKAHTVMTTCMNGCRINMTTDEFYKIFSMFKSGSGYASSFLDIMDYTNLTDFEPRTLLDKAIFEHNGLLYEMLSAGVRNIWIEYILKTYHILENAENSATFVKEIVYWVLSMCTPFVRIIFFNYWYNICGYKYLNLIRSDISHMDRIIQNYESNFETIRVSLSIFCKTAPLYIINEYFDALNSSIMRKDDTELKFRMYKLIPFETKPLLFKRYITQREKIYYLICHSKGTTTRNTISARLYKSMSMKKYILDIYDELLWIKLSNRPRTSTLFYYKSLGIECESMILFYVLCKVISTYYLIEILSYFSSRISSDMYELLSSIVSLSKTKYDTKAFFDNNTKKLEELATVSSNQYLYACIIIGHIVRSDCVCSTSILKVVEDICNKINNTDIIHHIILSFIVPDDLYLYSLQTDNIRNTFNDIKKKIDPRTCYPAKCIKYYRNSLITFTRNTLNHIKKYLVNELINRLKS